MRDVHMPKVGTSGAEAEIVEVLVQVGDHVDVGHELFEADSDKANFFIEAEVAGTVTEILVEVGVEYPTGTVVCRIDPDA